MAGPRRAVRLLGPVLALVLLGAMAVPIPRAEARVLRGECYETQASEDGSLWAVCRTDSRRITSRLTHVKGGRVTEYGLHGAEYAEHLLVRGDTAWVTFSTRRGNGVLRVRRGVATSFRFSTPTADPYFLPSGQVLDDAGVLGPVVARDGSLWFYARDSKVDVGYAVSYLWRIGPSDTAPTRYPEDTTPAGRIPALAPFAVPGTPDEVLLADRDNSPSDGPVIGLYDHVPTPGSVCDPTEAGVVCVPQTPGNHPLLDETEAVAAGSNVVTLRDSGVTQVKHRDGRVTRLRLGQVRRLEVGWPDGGFWAGNGRSEFSVGPNGAKRRLPRVFNNLDVVRRAGATYGVFGRGARRAPAISVIRDRSGARRQVGACPRALRTAGHWSCDIAPVPGGRRAWALGAVGGGSATRALLVRLR